ncbi:DUF6712 family protein [Arcicella sp. LKC2W]|uniref:DUF6712 family protein n=1 Tax=Arcicella sp. LKC2W TaxID=2984198 RepID=UPI002B2014A2|nr:DUF6712 family protein [Arcicella sp. LKC2W]MEA5458697.1 DUF6712 family protein [Arcicella sp. LKC2W]
MITITEDELKRYTGVTNSLKPDDLADTIKVVFNRRVLPYLSQEQFIVSEASSSNIHILLIESVKRAACCFAIAHDYMRFVLQHEKGAIKDKSAKDSKATKEDKEKSREDYEREGYDSVEDMRKLLEENPTVFTQWSNSSSFNIFNISFVYSTDIFNTWVDINSSRRTYYRLKPHIRKVEDLIISKLIDSSLLESLKTKAGNKTLIPIEKKVVEYIQAIIANHAIADALIKGSVIKDAYNTFTVFDDTSLSKTTGNRTAELERLKTAQKEYIDTANSYGDLMQKTISDNLTALGIVPTEPEEGYKYMNDPDAGFVLF